MSGSLTEILNFCDRECEQEQPVDKYRIFKAALWSTDDKADSRRNGILIKFIIRANSFSTLPIYQTSREVLYLNCLILSTQSPMESMRGLRQREGENLLKFTYLESGRDGP